VAAVSWQGEIAVPGGSRLNLCALWFAPHLAGQPDGVEDIVLIAGTLTVEIDHVSQVAPERQVPC
jgi:hypothetical protein